jgi:spoIIIJ-associated protein
MEWVETTGKSIEAALDAALDELGVHEDDVEYEVIEEPRTGFLGRLGGAEARIRVRIRPVSREKPADRRRRRGSGGSRSGRDMQRPRSRSGAGSSGGNGAPRGSKSSGGREGRGVASGAEGDMSEVIDIPIERQAASVTEFARGLVDAFGFDADISEEIEDDTITLRIDGPELGLLVGPKGATLSAIEELARAVLQKETGGHGARLRVDVGGYRAKRRAALEEFVEGLVEKVRASGNELALEPMSSSDRKVVHDTVAELDGVETTSEGEEPRRRVVIRPV